MYKVLIVEDEMLVRHGLKNSIDWGKYEMTVIGDVSNGKAALDFFTKNEPDLIITDIKMPIMGGMELIAKLREMGSNVRIIILSCLEEFDLVREAMSKGVSDYILKLTMTEEEIDNVLSKALRELQAQNKANVKETLDASKIYAAKEKLLKDYIFYSAYSEEVFANRLNSLDIHLKPERLAVSIMEIDHYEDLKVLFQDQKGYLTNFSLLNVISEILERYASAEVFHDEGARYILVFNIKEELSSNKEGKGLPLKESYGEVLKSLDKIRETLSVYFNTSVSFSLSSLGDGFAALGAMVQEAAEALNAKFYHEADIYFKKSDAELLAIARKKLEALKQLHALFGIQDEAFKNDYSNKIHTLLEDLSPHKEEIKHILYQLLYWISDRMHLKGDEFVASGISYGNSLKTAETLDEAIEILKEYIHTVRNFFKEKNAVSEYVSKAIVFMKTNYMQDLTLNDIAGHISISPNYFSSLFKKEMHLNFSEYLNEIRIEKAKELLRDTSLKSYEIAEKVGFKESSYFSTLFKRATGLSPYKYRQIWQKSWKEDAESESE